MAFNGIPATVLQKNNEQFWCDFCGNYGNTLYIPCGSNASLSPSFYAVPVLDNGVGGFRYDGGSTAPTDNSIQVFKLTNTLNGDFWWVVGDPADYYGACCEDCDVSPAPSMVTTVNSLAPIQYACTDDGTNYDAYFAVPALGGGQRYVSVVTQDGVTKTPHQSFATGSTSLANLITYLNTNYSAMGTWSNPGGTTVRLRSTSASWVGFIACAKSS
jgi:hypothetical protein